MGVVKIGFADSWVCELVKKVTRRLYDVRMGNYLFAILDKAIDHIHRQQTPEDANQSIVVQSC